MESMGEGLSNRGCGGGGISDAVVCGVDYKSAKYHHCR